jgi:DNA-binding NtrC family response regulator
VITILLVDDDRMVLELCVHVLLGLEGVDVLPECCGRDALDTAATSRRAIDVLLSDIDMPGEIDGMELARRLTRARPGIKVVLMSGLTTDGCGIPAEWIFLPKPFAPSGLIASVARSLGRELPVHTAQC